MTDELTTRLTRQLHDQVDDWHTAPLSLDSVRGQARSIRRTRRAVAGGAVVAAVLAVVVPLGLTQTTPDSQRPSITNTPTEDPTDAVDPTPGPDGTFPLTLDVAEGEVPASGYLVPGDQTFVTPDGTRELPDAYAQLLPYDGGWVGIRTPDSREGGDIEVVTMTADFKELSAAPTQGGLVPSSDRSRVAWVETTSAEEWTIVNASVDSGEETRVSTAAYTTVLGFLADDTLATQYELIETGEIFFAEAGAGGEVESRVLNGSKTLSKYQWVRGVSDAAGLVSGQTTYEKGTSCSEVRDTATEEVVFETCAYQLGAFSPDGRWLIGYQSVYDYGSPSLAILDATTGLPVVEFTSATTQLRSAVVMSAAWDDNDTIVAVVEENGEQAVVRAESNGSLTRSSDTAEVQMSIAFWLPTKVFGQN